MNLQLGKPLKDSQTGETCFPVSVKGFQLAYSLGGSTESRLLAEPAFLPFLDSLLGALGAYFSKTLDARIFRQRLRHTWKGPCGATLRGSSDTWVPRELRMAATSYTLCWGIQDSKGNPVSGLDAVDVVVLPEEGGVTGVPHLPLSSLEEVTEFPEEEGGAETDERLAARRRVRQARLRAAVAQLRAERLAERYYTRYGSFDGAGSDSELSSEVSEAEEGALEES